MTNSAGPTETELKFCLQAAQRGALEAHPALQTPRATAPRHSLLVSTYFDTLDHRLLQNGLSLRIRHDGNRYVQTLKNAGDGQAAWRRGEWEWPVAGDNPDPDLLAETPYADLAMDLIAKPFEPQYCSRVHRTTLLSRLPDATIEIAIDEGSIEAADRTEPIHELELELKQGSTGALYRLAIELHTDLGLCISSDTKAARGYRLKTGTDAAPVKAEEPVLDPDGDLASAIRSVIGNGLACLLANEPALWGRERVEALHQMRVALRHLRSSLVLFADRVEPHAANQFNEALRQFGQIFGAARDWDVFVEETLHEAASDPAIESGWLDLLAKASEAPRQKARLEAEAATTNPRLTGLVLGLAAFVESDLWQPDNADAKTTDICKLAPDLIDPLYRKARRRARKVDPNQPSSFHPLRKTMKKLRYGIEDLSSLFEPDAVKAFLHHCKSLQEILGTVNDTVVTAAFAAQLAGQTKPELTPALAALGRWSDQRRDKALEHFDKAWNKFEKARPFWRN